MRWRIHAANIRGHLRVGVYDYERVSPQKVEVSVVVEIDAPAFPKSIEETFDYDLVLTKVWQDWQQRGQIPLVEPLAAELAEYLMGLDARIAQVTVAIFKTEVWTDRAKVGVELTVKREDLPLAK